MFVGRERELESIENCLKNDFKNIMVYGKRKVGKTTLILEASKRSGRKLLYYECIRTSLINNVDSFVNNISKEIAFPSYVRFNSFEEVFDYLEQLNDKLLVIIDEYPYLKELENSNYVDSCFQRIIDKKYRNIDLILCGSHIAMMQQLLQEKNALFGRFTLVIKLEELDYYSCQKFYEELSPYDKVGFYSVFGGSPFINEQINPSKSLKDNICSLILNFQSNVFVYLNNLLLSDYSNKLSIERILYYLSNGKKKYSEIEQAVFHEKTGNLGKQLLPMIDMGIISRNVPINKLNDKKKVKYEICDNILRFYFTYLYNKIGVLQIVGAETFYEEYIEPTIKTFISYRFEEIGRQYFSLKTKNGQMKGIRNIGTYYYDDIVNKINGEFDIALEKEKGFDIIEVKYYKNKIDVSMVNKEINQIKSINDIEIDKIGFISINGFQNGVKLDYMIDGSNLYRDFDK